MKTLLFITALFLFASCQREENYICETSITTKQPDTAGVWHSNTRKWSISHAMTKKEKDKFEKAQTYSYDSTDAQGTVIKSVSQTMDCK